MDVQSVSTWRRSPGWHHNWQDAVCCSRPHPGGARAAAAAASFNTLQHSGSTRGCLCFGPAASVGGSCPLSWSLWRPPALCNLDAWIASPSKATLLTGAETLTRYVSQAPLTLLALLMVSNLGAPDRRPAPASDISVASTAVAKLIMIMIGPAAGLAAWTVVS